MATPTRNIYRTPDWKTSNTLYRGEVMKFRDLLAAPFWVFAELLDYLAIAIGGVWTSKMYIEQTKKTAELLETDTRTKL